MIKRILSAAVAAFVLCAAVYAEPRDNTQSLSETEYSLSFDSVDLAADSQNVQNYITDDSEKELMYDAENIIRRDGAAGEAWVVFEIPYLAEFRAVSYHLASDVAPLSFEFSKDLEIWEAAEVEIDETVDPERWTRLEYTASDIEGVRYIRVSWGEEKNMGNWWNPYFGGLYANVGDARPCEIVIDTDENLQIPVYESRIYTITARMLDNIGLEFDGEITWSVMPNENSDSGIEISESGEVEITADMEDGMEFTVRAENTESGLYAEKKFTLCAPMPGDTDGDNVITQTDIDEICSNYGKRVTADNRLCDADKNGVIDIIDLAYAARYMVIK